MPVPAIGASRGHRRARREEGRPGGEWRVSCRCGDADLQSPREESEAREAVLREGNDLGRPTPASTTNLYLGGSTVGWRAGLGIQQLGMAEPCLKRANPCSVPCPCRHYGSLWQPRPGTTRGPCQALAQRSTGHAVPGPCYVVPCSGQMANYRQEVARGMEEG